MGRGVKGLVIIKKAFQIICANSNYLESQVDVMFP